MLNDGMHGPYAPQSASVVHELGGGAPVGATGKNPSPTPPTPGAPSAPRPCVTFVHLLWSCMDAERSSSTTISSGFFVQPASLPPVPPLLVPPLTPLLAPPLPPLLVPPLPAVPPSAPPAPALPAEVHQPCVLSQSWPSGLHCLSVTHAR